MRTSRAHVLDHFPLPRHELQRLGHVLADLVQNPAAAGAGCQGRIDDALARQMLGQRAARRPAPLEAAHRDFRLCRCDLRRRLGLRGVFLQLGKRQFELLEDRAALRGLPELLASQLGDRVLELLDQQRAVLGLALGRAGARLRRQQRLVLGDDHRVRGSKLGRQRINGKGHVPTRITK